LAKNPNRGPRSRQRKGVAKVDIEQQCNCPKGRIDDQADMGRP